MIETALYTLLDNDAGLAAIVGDRIYPVEAPEGAARPLLVYSVVSSVSEPAFGADSALKRSRFTLLAASDDSALDAATTARAALAAVRRYRGTVGGITIQDIFVENDGTDFRDPQGKIWYRAADIIIHHLE